MGCLKRYSKARMEGWLMDCPRNISAMSVSP